MGQTANLREFHASAISDTIIANKSMDLNEFTRALTEIKQRARARASEKEKSENGNVDGMRFSVRQTASDRENVENKTTLSPKRNLLVQQIVDENPINVKCDDESKIMNKKPQVSEISLVSRGDANHKEHTKMRTEFNHNGNLRWNKPRNTW